MRKNASSEPLDVGTPESIETSTPAASPVPRNIPAIAAAGLTLAACGGGGEAGPQDSSALEFGSEPNYQFDPASQPTAKEASRLLAQATMGSSRADIEELQELGYEGWLSKQFDTPRAITHWDWIESKGWDSPNVPKGFEESVWRQLITGEDQLRQRVGMALFELLVIGLDGLTGNWTDYSAAAYLDVLMDNAFGNYRTLLEKVSTNAAMSQYLTFENNRKAEGGSQPDENYARELMQLFTLGVNELHPDGTVKLSGGEPIETYTQDDVSGLARVFTGFTWDPFMWRPHEETTPERRRRPLVQEASWHETGKKTFLGVTIPAGTYGFASLEIALDTIFEHSNVPPFVSKQLIQRLVTSNPSPAYVARVASIFANNGSGERGDLRAVVRAILLDPEARDEAAAANSTFGKLREPIMRVTGWARAFGASSQSDEWHLGWEESPLLGLGQRPGRSPSVFNFFRPGYAPPNTGISERKLVAPEFQITNEITAVTYLNSMETLIRDGIPFTDNLKPDYSGILPLAGDAQALVDEVNLVIAAGQVSAATLGTIRIAVESIPADSTGDRTNRVRTAILLVMATPEYLTLK